MPPKSLLLMLIWFATMWQFQNPWLFAFPVPTPNPMPQTLSVPPADNSGLLRPGETLGPVQSDATLSTTSRKDIPTIAKAASGAIVTIIMAANVAEDPEIALAKRFGGTAAPPPYKPIAQGTGFLVRPDGVIVTNYHVIEAGDVAVVKFPDGTVFAVDGVLAADKVRDLAIIKIHGKTFRTLTLGDSDRVQVGEEVVAIGNPLSLESTVSNGIVSGMRTSEEKGGKLLQTTAPISPGSSGGPLFNMVCEVIGINTMYLEGGENLNFAIPSNDAQRLLLNQSAKLQNLPNEAAPEKTNEETNTHPVSDTTEEARQYYKELMSTPNLDFILAIQLNHSGGFACFPESPEWRPEFPKPTLENVKHTDFFIVYDPFLHERFDAAKASTINGKVDLEVYDLALKAARSGTALLMSLMFSMPNEEFEQLSKTGFVFIVWYDMGLKQGGMILPRSSGDDNVGENIYDNLTPGVDGLPFGLVGKGARLNVQLAKSLNYSLTASQTQLVLNWQTLRFKVSARGIYNGKLVYNTGNTVSSVQGEIRDLTADHPDYGKCEEIPVYQKKDN